MKTALIIIGITAIVLIAVTTIILCVASGRSKTPDEQRHEDKEQAMYLERYRRKHTK